MDLKEKINEVRRANDIVSIISSYIPLEKRGKNYFGVCPFHDDTNPSMSVSSDKQIYKCFSCGASGNVFNFIMDYEKMSFKQALEFLASKAGISLPNMSLKIEDEKYDKYYKIYDIALRFYQNNLNSSYGNEAKEYLHKRGIDEQLIKTFKIGLSLKEEDKLTSLLLLKNYSLKDLELIGLSNNYKDLYINRIMFPLDDINGNPIGFSGRIYNSISKSKYINTKETPIFKKGELLYNYYRAKDEVRLSKKLILVEGFMDVIRLYSIGVKSVVALMGTSLTKEQIMLLKRISKTIIINLDGDSAGKKAMFEVGKVLEENGFDISVIYLKDNLDPDEYILKYGKDSYLSLLDNPISFSSYKLNYLKDGKDLTNIDDKSFYISKVLEEIANESDLIKKELILDELAKEFQFDVEILRKKLQIIEKSSRIETFKKEEVSNNKLKKEVFDKYQKSSIAICYFMLNSKEARNIYQKKLNTLPYKTYRLLANEILYYSNNNASFDIADFITTLNDKKELQDALKKVLLVEFAYKKESLEEYIKVILDYNSSQEIKRLKKLIKEEQDPNKKAILAEKIRLIILDEYWLEWNIYD